MSFAYLAILLASLCGMASLDWKFRLAFFVSPFRATVAVAACTALLLIWDVFGIALGIFFIGNSQFITGINLAPQLPLEEPFFLILLSYCAIALHSAFSKRLAR